MRRSTRSVWKRSAWMRSAEASTPLRRRIGRQSRQVAPRSKRRRQGTANATETSQTTEPSLGCRPLGFSGRQTHLAPQISIGNVKMRSIMAWKWVLVVCPLSTEWWPPLQSGKHSESFSNSLAAADGAAAAPLASDHRVNDASSMRPIGAQTVSQERHKSVTRASYRRHESGQLPANTSTGLKSIGWAGGGIFA